MLGGKPLLPLRNGPVWWENSPWQTATFTCVILLVENDKTQSFRPFSTSWEGSGPAWGLDVDPGHDTRAEPLLETADEGLDVIPEEGDH